MVSSSRDVGATSLEVVLWVIAADAAVVPEGCLACTLQGAVVKVHEDGSKVWPGIGCIWIFSPCFGERLSNVWGKPSMQTRLCGDPQRSKHLPHVDSGAHAWESAENEAD